MPIFNSTKELAQQRKKERQWKASAVERALLCLSRFPFRGAQRAGFGTQPVFAFLVNWARAKGCLRASENVFEYFFRLKKVFATAA